MFMELNYKDMKLGAEIVKGIRIVLTYQLIYLL